MTKGGPPWQIYGPGTQEPEAAETDTGKAGKDAGADGRDLDRDLPEPVAGVRPRQPRPR